MSHSWRSGLAARGAVAGTQLLRISSALNSEVCALAAGAPSASLLTLDRWLPAASRLTSHALRDVVAAAVTAEVQSG